MEIENRKEQWRTYDLFEVDYDFLIAERDRIIADGKLEIEKGSFYKVDNCSVRELDTKYIIYIGLGDKI